MTPSSSPPIPPDSRQGILALPTDQLGPYHSINDLRRAPDPAASA